MGLYSLYYVAILTGYFLPDMFGRRPILIWTSVFCATTLIIIAIITTVVTNPSDATQKASIALIFLWEFSFGVQSPLIWIVTAESAPTRNREKVLGMATFWGFGVSLLITFVAPYMQNAGYGGLGSKIVSPRNERINHASLPTDLPSSVFIPPLTHFVGLHLGRILHHQHLLRVLLRPRDEGILA